MKKVHGFLAVTMLVSIICVFGSHKAEAAGYIRRPVLVLLPARHRPLQLAFDLERFRPTVIVAYQQDSKSDSMVLHMWNSSAQTWLNITLNDLMNDDLFPARPRHAFIIGDNRAPPQILVDTAAAHAEIDIIESLQIPDMVNGFNTVYKFSRRDWEWLRKRYGFMIDDLNVARRQYNPYDIPASEIPVDIPEIQPEEGELPPAEVERKP